MMQEHTLFFLSRITVSEGRNEAKGG